MKFKKIVALVTTVTLLLFCSGCSFNFFSVESLLAPPVQSGKNGEVQEAFTTLMKDKKVQLKTPVSGDFQTAFVLFDINGDSVDEAFVFYTDASVESTVRMALLECVDDEWFISSDIKGAGSGIFDICFSDMDGDGLYEIFVSWSLFDSKITRIVSVYEPVAGNDGFYSLEAIGNEYCNNKSFVDFNGDLKNDLAVVYLDDTGEVQKSLLRLFSFSPERELVKYAEISLDSAITSVASIKSDIIKAGKDSYARLFIDCHKNEKMIFTEMVYWDIELLTPVRAYTEPATTTLRNYKVPCQDVDNDGNIEIPSITTLYGDEKQFSVTDYDEIYTFMLLDWINAKGDTNTERIQTLFNPLDSYLLKFPWNGVVSVRYDSVHNALLFCRWYESSATYGDELFSIAYRRDKEQDPYGEVLYETDDDVYYYDITEAGESFGITDEDLKSSFIKMK